MGFCRGRITAKGGFTIVELIMAMVINMILAVTIGIMVYTTFVVWARNRRSFELQQDAVMAVDIIGRAVRLAAAKDITVSGSALNIGNARFHVSSNSLYYDPDRFAAGAGDEIISKKVTSYSFSKDAVDPKVTVTMLLEDPPSSIPLNFAVSCRNR